MINEQVPDEPAENKDELTKRIDEQLKKTRRRKDIRLINPSDGLIASFLVPVVIMVLIYIQRGIFPFGEESFLRSDMYHQYAPFFSEFKDKLADGGSLFYSWNIGMGVNFAALYAYYLASPLNWLLYICPRGLVLEFMTYMIVIKTGLCGFTFAYYLKKHCRTNDFGIAYFGIFYALSGYLAAYSWNIMWLDCIWLFPLIMLGIERLVKNKNGYLYCITLGLSITSNYYISIMICIFLVIYFIVLCCINWSEVKGKLFEKSASFGFCSLLAGGMAAFVLLPEIYALQLTASGKSDFPSQINSYFSIFDMIARHIGNVGTEIGLDHWPNIYCGIAVLIFIGLYFMCRKIGAREKCMYGGLLIFFFASFSINVLNFIWHGFHYPNSLPCRQSFIYIFLVLFMCYRAYMHLKDMKWSQIAAAFGGSVVFVIMAEKLIDNKQFHFAAFYAAIIFLALYAGILYFYKRRKTNTSLLLFIALIIVSVEATANMAITSITTVDRTAYIRDNKSVRELVGSVTPQEVFYRINKTDYKTKNDGAWMNFPSVSLFSSTANADVSAFYKKIGCESSTNAYSIKGSTPLIDSLFSIKYSLYPKNQKNSKIMGLVSTEGGVFLYRNEYTLPVGFVVPENFEALWDTELKNPADVQNSLAGLAGAGDVLLQEHGEMDGSTYDFTTSQEGRYFAYVLNTKVEKVTASIGEDTKTFDNVNRGYLLDFGECEAGEEISLKSDDKSQNLDTQIYMFSNDAFIEVYNKLNENPLKISVWKDTFLEGTVEASQEGRLFLSIPYDKGWTVYIDNEKAHTEKILDAFLSVSVPEGTHKITLKYFPQGTGAGICISAVCVIILILIFVAGKFLRRHKYRMRRAEKELQKRQEIRSEEL